MQTELYETRFSECPCCLKDKIETFYNNPTPKNIETWQEFFYGGRDYFSQISKCASCDFQWMDVLPDDYVRLYEAQETGGYDALDKSRIKYFEKLKNMVDRELGEGFPLKQGILDIGCGNGAWLKLWKDRAPLYGAEINKTHIDSFTKHGIQHVTDEQIHNEKYSMICLFDYLEHVESPERFLTELAPSLAEDSAMVIGVPDMGKLIARIMGERYYLYCPMHFSYFNKKSLEILLKRVFPDCRISVFKSPAMQFDTESVLKWVGCEDIKLGKLNLWSPIGYKASLIAVVQKKQAA